jgi:hypothetical protein
MSQAVGYHIVFINVVMRSLCEVYEVKDMSVTIYIYHLPSHFTNFEYI